MSKRAIAKTPLSGRDADQGDSFFSQWWTTHPLFLLIKELTGIPLHHTANKWRESAKSESYYESIDSVLGRCDDAVQSLAKLSPARRVVEDLRKTISELGHLAIQECKAMQADGIPANFEDVEKVNIKLQDDMHELGHLLRGQMRRPDDKLFWDVSLALERLHHQKHLHEEWCTRIPDVVVHRGHVIGLVGKAGEIVAFLIKRLKETGVNGVSVAQISNELSDSEYPSGDPRRTRLVHMALKRKSKKADPEVFELVDLSNPHVVKLIDSLAEAIRAGA